VSLSSLKGYLNTRQRAGRISSSKEERAGSAPKLDEKARTLLEDDPQEPPYLTLQDRCGHIEAITGDSVGRSTMCRAIARIGSTRKECGTHTSRSVGSTAIRAQGRAPVSVGAADPGI
jgi:transposase